MSLYKLSTIIFFVTVGLSVNAIQNPFKKKNQVNKNEIINKLRREIGNCTNQEERAALQKTLGCTSAIIETALTYEEQEEQQNKLKRVNEPVEITIKRCTKIQQLQLLLEESKKDFFDKHPHATLYLIETSAVLTGGGVLVFVCTMISRR